MGEKGVWILLYRGEVQAEASSEQLLESFSVHLGVALDNARLIERDRQYAVVQERQLLAQGLHDSIAQALSYLNLQVQFLSDAIRTKDEKLTEESLGAIRTGVQECYEDVRELLLNFRERIHKEGFAEGVRTVVERFEAQSGVKANCTISGTGPALTERQKLQGERRGHPHRERGGLPLHRCRRRSGHRRGACRLAPRPARGTLHHGGTGQAHRRERLRFARVAHRRHPRRTFSAGAGSPNPAGMRLTCSADNG